MSIRMLKVEKKNILNLVFMVPRQPFIKLYVHKPIEYSPSLFTFLMADQRVYRFTEESN